MFWAYACSGEGVNIFCFITIRQTVRHGKYYTSLAQRADLVNKLLDKLKQQLLLLLSSYSFET